MRAISLLSLSLSLVFSLLYLSLSLEGMSFVGESGRCRASLLVVEGRAVWIVAAFLTIS
jgi:hypothetical protein